MPDTEASGTEVSPAMIRRVALASTIGTTVEWYDFFIYATASSLVFNKLFFPNLPPLIGTLVALATYAAGFLARPLGGLLFGYIGDRYGRKSALVTTLLIVGTATFVIGLMPTYGTIGIFAPLILVFIRLLHGFGIGGEQGNAILITFEHAPAARRGYFGSWVMIGAPAGFVMPLALFAILDAILTPDQFLAWGWRLPFLLSVVLVAIGLYIRLHLTESPLFVQARRHAADGRNPLAVVVQQHWRALVWGCCAKFGESTVFTAYAVIIVGYGVSQGLSRQLMINSTLVAIVLELVTIPLFGALSDRIGRRPVYLFGAIVGLAVTFPAFAMVYGGWQGGIWISLVLVLAVSHAAMYAPQAAFFAEMFPTAIRASGISLILQMGGLLGSVGGLAAGWLLAAEAGAPWYYAAYVVAGAVITVVGTSLLPETAPARLLKVARA